MFDLWSVWSSIIINSLFYLGSNFKRMEIQQIFSIQKSKSKRTDRQLRKFLFIILNIELAYNKCLSNVFFFEMFRLIYDPFISSYFMIDLSKKYVTK